MKWNNKAIKILSYLIKIVIVILALWFLYWEIFKNEDFEAITFYYKSISMNVFTNLSLAVALFLMPLNWFLEAKKWQYLIGKIEKISTINSLKSILSGVTISAILPNRTGEFLGRITYINKADRIKAALISIIGSLSQLTVTITFGAISLTYLLYTQPLKIDSLVILFACIVLLAIAIIVPIIYFNTAVLFTITRNVNFLQKYIRYARVFRLYNYNELNRVLLFSIGRYIVFTLQFIVLLTVFDVDISLINSVLSIAASFFVISAIPTPALVEIGIREAVSLLFIGLFSSNTIGIISATFLLWIINIAVPSFVGIVFIWRAKLLKIKHN